MTNSNQSSTKPSRPRALNISLFIVTILSFLGFADASYLTADHYLRLPLPCTLNGCEIVLTSKYATMGFIPTSLLGVLYYLSVLFLTVYIFTSNRAGKALPWIILGITTVGLATSSFLVYLQFVVIHSICMYCMGSASITLLLFISSILMVRSSQTTQSAPSA